MTNCQKIHAKFLSAIDKLSEDDYKMEVKYFPPFCKEYTDGFVEEHPELVKLSVYYRPSDHVVFREFNSEAQVLKMYESGTENIFEVLIKVLKIEAKVR